MCDFHSIVVRRDGAVAHIAKNSHSGAVQAAGWRENDQMADFRGPFFVEAEWDGLGKLLSAEKITRGDPNEKQLKKIAGHYEALHKVLSDPAEYGQGMCFGGGIFSAPEYADVRWKVYVHPACPKRLAAKLAATELHSDGSPVKSLHPSITKLGGNLVIAKDSKIECNLTEVAGEVRVYQGATLTAPALTEVAGYVSVYQGATLTAPALTKAGYVRVYQGATLTAPADFKKKHGVNVAVKTKTPVQVVRTDNVLPKG